MGTIGGGSVRVAVPARHARLLTVPALHTDRSLCSVAWTSVKIKTTIEAVSAMGLTEDDLSKSMLHL